MIQVSFRYIIKKVPEIRTSNENNTAWWYLIELKRNATIIKS